MSQLVNRIMNGQCKVYKPSQIFGNKPWVTYNEEEIEITETMEEGRRENFEKYCRQGYGFDEPPEHFYVCKKCKKAVERPLQICDNCGKKFIDINGKKMKKKEQSGRFMLEIVGYGLYYKTTRRRIEIDDPNRWVPVKKGTVWKYRTSAYKVREHLCRKKAYKPNQIKVVNAENLPERKRIKNEKSNS
jgi:hypothetical protein